MKNQSNFPSGEWNGFYLEKHQPKRGWMHLYMKFEDGVISGEGTDYVGPWVCSGTYDPETHVCHWKKDYIGKHAVTYTGQASENGIMGQWEIACMLTGEFHIWPRTRTDLNELYMQQDLEMAHLEGRPGTNTPTTELGTVPIDDFFA